MLHTTSTHRSRKPPLHDPEVLPSFQPIRAAQHTDRKQTPRAQGAAVQKDEILEPDCNK